LVAIGSLGGTDGVVVLGLGLLDQGKWSAEEVDALRGGSLEDLDDEIRVGGRERWSVVAVYGGLVEVVRGGGLALGKKISEEVLVERIRGLRHDLSGGAGRGGAERQRREGREGFSPGFLRRKLLLPDSPRPRRTE
jgi:hypothetical protein